MSLADKLTPKEPSLASRIRAPHPKGWEPGVKFISEDVQYITTEVLGTLEGEPDWRTAIENMGIEIPVGYRVRIAEMKFDPAAWTRDSPDQDKAVTKAVWRYRFIVEPDTTAVEVDFAGILNTLKRTKHKQAKANGDATLVLTLNDTQIGKDTGGGTDATIERLDRFFNLAQFRLDDVRKQVGELVILMVGDLVEGCSIYPNQSFQIDKDRRAQIRDTTLITLDMLDRFAPQFDSVRVMAVPGNHGEHRIGGKRVNRHDNDDQLVAEGAALAAERDPKLGHVAFNIAYEQAALTMDVQGHILGATHGSVFGKTAGNPSQKAYNWFKNMAAGRNPVGDSDVLVSAHFHHEQIVNWGTMLWTQLPAMDGGSPEFAEYSGTDCAPGMATWLMSKENKFFGYEVLR